MDHTVEGVWVTRRNNPPGELKRATGIVIAFGGLKPPSKLVEDKVHECRVFILKFGSVSQHFDFLAKVAFLAEGKTNKISRSVTEWVMEAQHDSRQCFTLAEFQKEFFPLVILLGNRRAYETIIGNFGMPFFKRWLPAANELAAMHEFRPGSRLLREVRQSPHGLWAKLFREDEERFALIDFPRMLKKNSGNDRVLADIDSIQASVPLWKGQLALPMQLTFPVVLGQQQLQNVIIGPNGSGKTNLLLGLAKCVLAEDILVRTVGDTRPHAAPSHRIPVVVFTYERSAWSRLGTNNVEIHEQGVSANQWRKFTQLIYDIGSQDENGDGIYDLRKLLEILAGFINVGNIRLAIHPRTAAVAPPGKLNRKDSTIALKTLSESDPDVFRDLLPRLDRQRPPIMFSIKSDGRSEKPYALSSGERSLTMFCTRLIKSSRKSALVLIDEPENHLHPRFITLMVQALSRTLQATGSRALLVTHSPFVVREFERSTVKVMKRNRDGIPELYRPAMQTLGGDVSMISDYVFEDTEIKKGFEESIDRAMRRQSLKNNFVGGDMTSILAEGLGEDAMSYLVAMSNSPRKDGTDA